ncbi:D-alanyl-D-alanine carboxypeptidase [Streptomyces sp. BH106]|uniref:D-alanyl-D-alanine carboxypeptidase family protein n=1 Tax=Streptomyces sp. BH106 TaxID=3410409 RepID=UPI003CF5E913
MAGTPDKSGEHKASGGPAPEDPRLAVSRGVDQETAVFSVRDAAGEDPDTGASAPDPDAGDERLRAAVAAWVAGDEGSAGASAIANPGGGDGEADSAGAADPDDADAGAEPTNSATGSTGDANSDTDASTKTSASENDDKADATNANKPAAKAGAGSDAKGGGKPAAGDDAKPAAEADARGAGKPTDAADSEADAKSGAQDDAQPVAAAEADAPEDAKADAKPAAGGDSKSGSESGPMPAAKSGARGDGKSATEADAQSAAEADADGDGEADAKSGAQDGAKRAAEAGAKADATSGAQPDGKAARKPADKADGKSDAKVDRPADAKGGAKSDGKPDAESDRTANAEADGKPAAAADRAADAKGGAQPGTKSDGKPEAKSGAQPGAKADGKPDAKGDGKPGAKADAEPGAKAESAADGKVDRPVDQPTAVFKALPQPVDQPTTTLKAAGTAKSSKFVPLKGLDEGTGKGTGKELPPEAEQPTVEPAERTTQQPLPPKPPLDLLAELTNTPPPPETRVRTAVRRVKVWTPLVILLVIVFGVVQAVRPLPTPSLTLTSDATYSFDGDKASLPWPDEGQGWMDVQGIGTMDDFGKQTPVPIGSVAKSMTAYIVLKDHPLKAGDDGPSITVDATAEKEGGYDADGQNESTLNTVKEGDKISQKDALAAVMIPSANNIARLLARWDAGSEEAFVKKMNATAKKLGMKNTTYTDPSGLKESTVSTAEDQVKLGNELVQIPALTDITKLPTWTDPSGKKWTNYNRLVPYDGAIGIKTGTTTKAGGNLLFAATKDAGGSTVTVVGAILGQHKAPIIDTVNAVSKTAMLAAQDAVTSSTVLKKGDVVGYVDDQLGGHTPVTVTKDVKAVGWAGKTVHLQLADQDGKSVPHTGKAGETVGVLEVGDGEGGAVEVPVALQKSLTEPGFGAKLTRVG